MLESATTAATARYGRLLLPAGAKGDREPTDADRDWRSSRRDHAAPRRADGKTLGSADGQHLKLDLTNVAALHARLVWDARGLVLSDAGSETGTYVNGERLTAARVLADGDRIFLGPPGSKNTAKLLATGVPAAGKSDAIMLDLETGEGDPARRGGAAVPARQPAPAAASKAAATRPRRSTRPSCRRSLRPIACARSCRCCRPPRPRARARRRQPRAPRFRMPELPRAVWIGLAAALVAGGGLAVFLSLRQPPAGAERRDARARGAGPDRHAHRHGLRRHGGRERRPRRRRRWPRSARRPRRRSQRPSRRAVPAGDVQVRVEREGRGSNALS